MNNIRVETDNAMNIVQQLQARRFKLVDNLNTSTIDKALTYDQQCERKEDFQRQLAVVEKELMLAEGKYADLCSRLPK